MLRRALRWFPVLVGGFFPISLAAQSGSIEGRVSDSTGTALGGVHISVDGTGLRTQSDARGNYVIRGIPPGNRIVRGRSIGYLPGVTTVAVSPGATTRADLILGRPRTVRLPGGIPRMT